MSSPALLLVDDATNAAAAAAVAAASSSSSSSSSGIGGGGLGSGVGGGSGSISMNHVIVNAVVLLHVLDHHSRRNDFDGRVIGTLLGRRLDGTGTIEVTNCFAVPHAEHGDEVAIGKDYNKKMYNLYKRTNRKEVIVGWYATAASPGPASDAVLPASSLVTDTSSLIHEFYAGESDEEEPVHLVFDTRMILLNQQSPQPSSVIQPAIGIRAYKNVPVVVQGEHLGNVFHELQLTLHTTEPDAICFHEMMKTDGLTMKNQDDSNKTFKSTNHGTSNNDELDSLHVTMDKLYDSLTKTLSYVDAVVAGTKPPDAEIGRQIADTLAVVPRIRPEIFDQMFHGSLQDLLMVTYLANMTRTQTTIAEKLNASLGI